MFSYLQDIVIHVCHQQTQKEHKIRYFLKLTPSKYTLFSGFYANRASAFVLKDVFSMKKMYHLIKQKNILLHCECFLGLSKEYLIKLRL